MVAGGAGSAVNEYVVARGLSLRMLNLGLPDRFIEQATPAEQLHDCRLDAAGIEASVQAALRRAQS